MLHLKMTGKLPEPVTKSDPITFDCEMVRWVTERLLGERVV